MQSVCIKKGKTSVGIQKWQCGSCKKYQRSDYTYKGADPANRKLITLLITESCGIRSIARILKLSTTTVTETLKRRASEVQKPVLLMHQIYEADEIRTYVGCKENECWVMYAIDRKTRTVADLKVGRRNKHNLRQVVDSLLLSGARKIYTDFLPMYPGLIPEPIHRPVQHAINYIERKNLTVRTHIKALARRIICYPKSAFMLEAILKIYFWG